MARLEVGRARELARLIEGELGFLSSPGDVSNWLRDDPLNPVLAGTVAAYAALWLFVTGGILDRFARGRPIYTAAFFAACGVYFVRFLRLAVLIGAAYFVLFRWLYPFLFETVRSLWTGDPDGLGARAVVFGVFGAALASVLRSLDEHPRPLRLVYVNPVEEEQVVATGRARLVRAVSDTGTPDEAPTSARICLYELR